MSALKADVTLQRSIMEKTGKNKPESASLHEGCRQD
jgi:hypothetical protein